MKQLTLSHAANQFQISAKPTRKRVFLLAMEQVVPWERLLALIAPHTSSPGANGGRPPFPASTMRRIDLLQQWFGAGDQAMEGALHDIPLYREFCGLNAGVARLPDESTILCFRHLLERHGLAGEVLATVKALLVERGLILKNGAVVDATLIATPSSTKNCAGSRNPEMLQTKKGNNRHFGMKAHIGVDAESGLVHSVAGTAANVHDLQGRPSTPARAGGCGLRRCGLPGADKREELQGPNAPTWHVAMRPGRRKAQIHMPWGEATEAIEKRKASVRAKVEHPFRVIQRQFRHVKVRYKGLAKNTAQLKTLFALSNLRMARRQLLGAVG